MQDLKKGYKRTQYPYETKRYCQILQLKLEEGKVDQYKYWHSSQNIWKEIPLGIRKCGILDMEIYLLGDFAVMIIDAPLGFSWDDAFSKLATYERQAEWEEFVSQFQEVDAGKRSEEKWNLMERIFSLEDSLKENINK